MKKDEGTEKSGHQTLFGMEGHFNEIISSGKVYSRIYRFRNMKISSNSTAHKQVNLINPHRKLTGKIKRKWFEFYDAPRLIGSTAEYFNETQKVLVPPIRFF